MSVNGIDKKVSVNGIDIFRLEKVAGQSAAELPILLTDPFSLEAQDAAWLASYQWNIRARFITS